MDGIALALSGPAALVVAVKLIALGLVSRHARADALHIWSGVAIIAGTLVFGVRAVRDTPLTLEAVAAAATAACSAGVVVLAWVVRRNGGLYLWDERPARRRRVQVPAAAPLPIPVPEPSPVADNPPAARPGTPIFPGEIIREAEPAESQRPQDVRTRRWAT